MAERSQFDETSELSQHFFGPGWAWDQRAAAVCRLTQQQNAWPSTSFPLSWLLCPLFSFFFPPRSHDSFPLLPVASWTPFQSFHEYIYVFAGEERVCCEGCRALCAGRLYWLWQESPPAPGRVLQGQSCPQAQSNQQQSKSDTPPRVGWKMTGQDIVPGGHLQLTAINDTTHGGWGGKDLILSFLCFHSLRVLFLKLFALYVVILRTKGRILKENSI